MLAPGPIAAQASIGTTAAQRRVASAVIRGSFFHWACRSILAVFERKGELPSSRGLRPSIRRTTCEVVSDGGDHAVAAQRQGSAGPWRRGAGHCRADECPEAKRIMLGIADGYERMAKLADERLAKSLTHAALHP